MTDPVDAKFSLVIGGPFYRWQERLGLLGPDLLPNWVTVGLFVVVAWLPPAVLALVENVGFDPDLGLGGFFLDHSLYARFILGIAALLAMERFAEGRIGMVVQQFLGADLLTPADSFRFKHYLELADHRTSSNLVELCILVVAFLLSFNGASVYLLTLGSTWFGSYTDAGIALSWAGWWVLMVSFPLFWFLVLRWFWRFVVWTILLHATSKLQLRLVATHPDQCGGLGFLFLFPATFSILVFTLSCVSASVVLQEVTYTGLSLEMVGGLFVVWTLLMFAIFIGPLSVFSLPLVRLRNQALLDYGRLASIHNQLFEQRWILTRDSAPELVGTPDISSLSDLGASFELIRSMRPMPVDFQTFRLLFMACALPWMVIVLSQIPLFELLSIVTQAVL